MNMSTKVATEFWTSQKRYPFSFTRKRRLHELNYLVPRLEKLGGKRLLDLGCGDGSLLECLLRITDYEELHGYDVAADLLAGIDPRISTRVYDISDPGPLPEVDATIVAGVIQYVFDDDVVDRVLSLVRSPMIWLRSTCTLKPECESVERDDYASKYRTIDETRALIAKHFNVTSVERVYPDELESAYGTKQFYFEGTRRL
ncbi:MAG: hypothetical protein KF790_06775 [Steroidobacteraceae bacterium]|nr:hypothetical protein [Steroidobacteraceae bacterium]MCW5571902.1 hypothetical protein [Steroidobacteraceae bacterium]